ncbi:YraN family protein [Emcibacter sp.]|uniref:YraN family protein n=1 Tax=Emcibacter sp. TaxID=1979954 RepID=UPI003A8E4B96
MGEGRRKKAYKKGIFAEHAAVALLWLKGYRIRERRFKCPFGEIDIIAAKGNLIAFVEVKTRGTYEEAAESILFSQRRRISRAANWYIAQNSDGEPSASSYSYRFDSILLVPWNWPCHILDAWQEES